MKPFVIGVAGGTGSGKTFVVRTLVEELGDDQVVVIEHDSYYHPDSNSTLQERAQINYDHPDSLETSLLVRHLDMLRRGESVGVPIYDFSNHSRLAETRPVEPLKVIIVEGILVLCEAELRERMDLRIFVSTDDDVRFIRRLQRDLVERGRTPQSVIQQYLTTVKPMHLQFVSPSKRYADLIIPGDGDIRIAIEVLVAKIRSVLADSRHGAPELQRQD